MNGQVTSAILAIDPFLLSYVLGLAILLFFVRERLDVPSNLAGISTEGMVSQFLQRLPPSSVRVTRYFFFACLVYFLGLAIFFTFICMLFALGAEGLTPTEAGFSQDHAVGGLGLVAAEPPNVDGGIVDALIGLTSRKSLISDYPWNPLVMALGMIGLLPSLPYVARFENWIRHWSLWVVGIPSSVIGLWNELKLVNVKPILDEVDVDRTDVAELSEIFRRFTKVDEAATADFQEKLAKIVAFGEIDSEWPELKIKTLFTDKAPTGLSDNVIRILTEVDHLRSLSLAVDAAVPGDTPAGTARISCAARGTDASAPAAVAAPDLTDADAASEHASSATKAEAVDVPTQNRTPDAIERATETEIEKAREIVGERWKEIAKQLRGTEFEAPGQADLCCLMMALYAERSPNLNKKSTPFVALEWIRRARAAKRGTASSVNLYLFAGWLAIMLASLVMYFLSIASENTALQLVMPAGNTRTQVILSMALRLMVMLLPSVLAVYMIRETLDREAKWHPWTELLAPRTFQYLGVAALAYVSGFLAHLLYIFVDPYISGIVSQTSGLSNFFSSRNLTEAALAALSGTVLAIVLCLTYDQEERENNLKFALLMIFLGTLLILLLGMALLFDPLYLDLRILPPQDFAINEQIVRWLMTIGVGFMVFVFVVASIQKRRNS